MKIRIILVILFTQYLFSQEKPIVYENNAKAYYNKDFSEFSNERSFCDLTIFPDSTFSFYSRPYMSCFTWQEIKGIWKREKNVYTFLSQYEVEEEDTRLVFNSDPQERFLLKFRTDRDSELKNRKIKIEYIYDFDARIEDVERTMSFDKKDNIEIRFTDIPNLDKLASIRIKYQLSPGEKRDKYITENKIANVKKKNIPNVVEIEFVEKPKKEIVNRTTIGKVEGEKLEIVSNVKTKTSLPDYLEEINFEKYYELIK